MGILKNRSKAVFLSPTATNIKAQGGAASAEPWVYARNDSGSLKVSNNAGFVFVAFSDKKLRGVEPRVPFASLIAPQALMCVARWRQE